MKVSGPMTSIAVFWAMKAKPQMAVVSNRQKSATERGMWGGTAGERGAASGSRLRGEGQGRCVWDIGGLRYPHPQSLPQGAGLSHMGESLDEIVVVPCAFFD